ncbi:hypothetical protein Tco_0972488 [Tanacetum coccineum]
MLFPLTLQAWLQGPPSVDLSFRNEKFKTLNLKGYGLKGSQLTLLHGEELAIPVQTVLGQTATGKESSNPFMAGSFPKTISLMIHISQEIILLKEERTGDLKMMFDPNEEDDIWLNQHYWELLRWKLHEYSGVNSLFLDGTSIQINMLVDKKYPLKKEILKK